MALINVKSEGARRLARFCGVIAAAATLLSILYGAIDSNPEGVEVAIFIGMLVILPPLAYAAVRLLVLSIAWVIEGFKARPPD